MEGVTSLANGMSLARPNLDHRWSGEWSAYRDLHIRLDLVLYRKQRGLLSLVIVA